MSRSAMLRLAAALFAAPSAMALSATPQSNAASLVQTKGPAELTAEFEQYILVHKESSTKQLRGPAPLDAFLPGCLKFSKALVYQNEGSTAKVTEQMHVICSSLSYAPDVKVCDAYLESLLGHLHVGEEDWNLNGMDYGLYCEGMHKVETELAR